MLLCGILVSTLLHDAGNRLIAGSELRWPFVDHQEDVGVTASMVLPFFVRLLDLVHVSREYRRSLGLRFVGTIVHTKQCDFL